MPRIGLTREKLIEAASVIADESGFEQLTLASLARLYKVSLPSLYSHVSSSDDLKVGVALLGLEKLAAMAEEAIAGRSGRDALRALANVHRSFARLHPGLFHAARHPIDRSLASGSGGARLAEISLAMLRGYGLEGDDCVHAVRLFGSFVLGFTLLDAAGSFGHRPPPSDTSWERGVEAIDALIRSWSKH